MEIGTFTVVRHTINFESMSRFYGESLGMTIVEQWDRPGSRGAVFAPQGPPTTATIEVLELGDVCVPGVAPVNVVLSLFVEDARAALDQLRDAGVVIARGLEDQSWGFRSFGIDDPDGLRIWVVEVLEDA
jgi:catechol 2,3-dioxygenase-like lactoylglutathione lyase family enzyme